MHLLLASRNPHKTREFQELLGKEFLINDLNSLPEIKIASETGATFVENATLKAVSASKHHDSFTIADDSGLEVDVLRGAPGIYSARYAGQHATDRENVDTLLSALSNVSNRSARFRCVIALARNGKLIETFAGDAEGKIVDPPRGINGFGYDPVFQPNGFEQTFAEMAAELKNRISHRAKTIAALRDALREIQN